ncbi:MAG: hypothetical protein ACOC44_03625 [Promethearchaeia archaeon]
MNSTKDPKKIAILGILLIAAPYLLLLVFGYYYYSIFSYFTIPLMIFGFLLIFYAGYVYFKVKNEDNQKSNFLGGQFTSKGSFPQKRHDIIKSTNWYRKERKKKNWRIMGDVTFSLSLTEPTFRDPHTFHLLMRHILENFGCIIQKDRDPTFSP